MNLSAIRRAAIAMIAGAVLVVTGCSASVSVGDKKLSKDSLQSKLADEIGAGEGSRPDVRCDGDLKGEVGATQKCQVMIAGQAAPFTVTVTSIDGDTINFRYVRDDLASATDSPTTAETTATEEAATAVERATVESTTADHLNRENPGRDLTVSCPGNLAAQIGTTMRCSATAADGEEAEVLLTVTSIEGTRVNWDVQLQ